MLKAEEWLENPHNVEEMGKLVDAMVDRQVVRLRNSYAGMHKGTAPNMPAPLMAGGKMPKLDFNSIIGMILSRYLPGAQQEALNPQNPSNSW